MSGLSDYLNSLNRDGWSTRRISEEAEKRGHKLSNATASRYLSGKHGTPGQDVIEAFAAVFHVSADRVREAAELPGLGQPFELGPEFSRLSGPQREAIRTVARLFLEQNDAVADPPVPDGATTLPAEHWKLAASKGPRRMEDQDRRAAAAGEESQDPGHDHPA